MNENEVNLTRMEESERWLREVLETSREVGTAAVKHRVRIAVQEEWLKAQLGAADSIAPLDRTRSAVRAVIQEKTMGAVTPHGTPVHGARSESLRLSAWLRGALALAAVLAIAFVVPRLFETGSGNRMNVADSRDSGLDTDADSASAESGPAEAASADLAAWTRGSEEDSNDDLDLELDALRVQFDQASETFAQGWASDSAEWDDLIDDNSADGTL